MKEQGDIHRVVEGDRLDLGCCAWVHDVQISWWPLEFVARSFPHSRYAEPRPSSSAWQGVRMPSVVIAAHNEEHLIGACLRAIADQDFSGDVQVVVSANGCTDHTAEVARQAGVEVVDRPDPGKTAALNAGDAVATSFPRIYLDADIILPRNALSSFTTLLGPGKAALPSSRDGASRQAGVPGRCARTSRSTSDCRSSGRACSAVA